MTHLIAILLNPPLTTGAASLRHVDAARQALICNSVTVVNLFSIPTRSVEDINALGKGEGGWHQARGPILSALRSADVLLGGWGISGLNGDAARMRKCQVAWFAKAAMDEGLDKIWTVGGAPRHPSRWHQYVSDKYQRASGNSLDQRLSSVLASAPLSDLL